jgi:hypothetical protein
MSSCNGHSRAVRADRARQSPTSGLRLPAERIMLGSAHHHVDVAAAALRAHEPLAPIRHGHLGAVSLGHLRRVGLDLVAAMMSVKCAAAVLPSVAGRPGYDFNAVSG